MRNNPPRRLKCEIEQSKVGVEVMLGEGRAVEGVYLRRKD